MKDFVIVGSAPYEEDCAQVGSDDYGSRVVAECKAFIGQIHRAYGDNEGVTLRMKAFSHDFGCYHEVVALFDHDDSDAAEFAYELEDDPKNLLGTWDQVSLDELGKFAPRKYIITE